MNDASRGYAASHRRRISPPQRRIRPTTAGLTPRSHHESPDRLVRSTDTDGKHERSRRDDRPPLSQIERNRLLHGCEDDVNDEPDEVPPAPLTSAPIPVPCTVRGGERVRRRTVTPPSLNSQSSKKEEVPLAVVTARRSSEPSSSVAPPLPPAATSSVSPQQNDDWWMKRTRRDASSVQHNTNNSSSYCHPNSSTVSRAAIDEEDVVVAPPAAVVPSKGAEGGWVAFDDACRRAQTSWRMLIQFIWRQMIQLADRGGQGALDPSASMKGAAAAVSSSTTTTSRQVYRDVLQQHRLKESLMHAAGTQSTSRRSGPEPSWVATQLCKILVLFPRAKDVRSTSPRAVSSDSSRGTRKLPPSASSNNSRHHHNLQQATAAVTIPIAFTLLEHARTINVALVFVRHLHLLVHTIRPLRLSILRRLLSHPPVVVGARERASATSRTLLHSSFRSWRETSVYRRALRHFFVRRLHGIQLWRAAQRSGSGEQTTRPTAPLACTVEYQPQQQQQETLSSVSPLLVSSSSVAVLSLSVPVQWIVRHYRFGCSAFPVADRPSSWNGDSPPPYGGTDDASAALPAFSCCPICHSVSAALGLDEAPAHQAASAVIRRVAHIDHDQTSHHRSLCDSSTTICHLSDLGDRSQCHEVAVYTSKNGLLDRRVCRAAIAAKAVLLPCWRQWRSRFLRLRASRVVDQKFGKRNRQLWELWGTATALQPGDGDRSSPMVSQSLQRLFGLWKAKTESRLEASYARDVSDHFTMRRVLSRWRQLTISRGRRSLRLSTQLNHLAHEQENGDDEELRQEETSCAVRPNHHHHHRVVILRQKQEGSAAGSAALPLLSSTVTQVLLNAKAQCAVRVASDALRRACLAHWSRQWRMRVADRHYRCSMLQCSLTKWIDSFLLRTRQRQTKAVCFERWTDRCRRRWDVEAAALHDVRRIGRAVLRRWSSQCTAKRFQARLELALQAQLARDQIPQQEQQQRRRPQRSVVTSQQHSNNTSNRNAVVVRDTSTAVGPKRVRPVKATGVPVKRPSRSLAQETVSLVTGALPSQVDAAVQRLPPSGLTKEEDHHSTVRQWDVSIHQMALRRAERSLHKTFRAWKEFTDAAALQRAQRFVSKAWNQRRLLRLAMGTWKDALQQRQEAALTTIAFRVFEEKAEAKLRRLCFSRWLERYLISTSQRVPQ